MSGASVQLDSLSRRLGGRDVLRGLSLEVEAGEWIALLGPSGAGKTTLLRAIAGLEAPDAGRVLLGGREAVSIPPRDRGVGFVFQDLALWPHMSVSGNLGFVMEARGVRGADAAKRAREAVDAVGLPAALLERRPGELSGGERQRAAIARVLVQEPAVVLLDEPLTNLDRELRVQILAMLRKLRAERGLASLLVTHDRDEAFALADRVAVLRAGRVEQHGTPEDIYATPASRYVARLVGTASFVPAERRDGTFATALGSWPADGAPNGPVVAVFRPEMVRFSGQSGVRGRCVDAFYRGDHWLHTVEVEAPGARPSVLVRAARPAKPGEAVTLEADRPAFVADNGSEEA
jgi:iron(III) transport system ATP-binding protein